MTTDREAAEWVARTYRPDVHPTVAALAAAYLRALALHQPGEPMPIHGGVVERCACLKSQPCPTVQALDLTRRGCPGCGALIPNDMARCALCGWPTEVTP